MTRTSRLFFPIGITLTFLFNACKKDNNPDIRSESGSLLTLAEAKQWYNQQKVGDLQTLSSKNGLGIPEWNKSTSLKPPVGKSQLKVEMSDPGSTKIVYRDLLLTKDATGLITGNLQEIWPEPHYLSSKRGKVNADGDVRQYIDYSDFTGVVLIYDLTGKFTKGRFYLAGTIADEVVPRSAERLVKTEGVDLPESFCSVHPEHPGCKWFRDQLGITLPEVEVTAPRINPTPDPDFTGFPQISNPVGGSPDNFDAAPTETYTNGKNKIEIYWWGYKVYLSNQSLNYIAAGTGFGAVIASWIPEPLASKIAATVAGGISAAAWAEATACPNGAIVTGVLPGITPPFITGIKCQ